MTIRTVRLPSETVDALHSLKNVPLSAIATDSIHVYEGQPHFGASEIGFRNDRKRSLLTFKTRWETIDHEDIHLFVPVQESDSDIPRRIDGKGFSVGPCSWVNLSAPSQIEGIEVAELEICDPDLVWDWGIVLHLKSGQKVSFATEYSAIIGEIEIRLSGGLRAPEYGGCALRLRTLFN